MVSANLGLLRRVILEHELEGSSVANVLSACRVVSVGDG